MSACTCNRVNAYLALTRDRNQKLSDKNKTLENRVGRLREEVLATKKENDILINMAYDIDKGMEILEKIR